MQVINTLSPGQSGCQFADDIIKCIFLNENFSVSNEISLEYVSSAPIDNISALV